MKIIIKENYEEVSVEAANFLANEVKTNPTTILGLATGSTPIGTYENLVAMNLDWSGVKTFNLDEYVGVEGTHEASYRYFMNHQLFDKVNINKANTFVPSGVADPKVEGPAYDKKIAEAGGVDIQLLGIGENAHIGFNEPFAEKDSTTQEVKLTESTINANARMFANKDDVPKTAISMGIKTIMQSKRILLVASGPNKAQAIKDTVEGKITGDVPASYLQDHKDVTIIVDKAAAALLTK